MKKDYTPLTEPELPEEYKPEDLEMPDTYFENLYSADEVDTALLRRLLLAYFAC